MQQLVFNMHFPMWPFFEANVRPPIFLCSLQWSLPYQQQIIPRSQCYPDSRLFRFVHDITLDFHSIPRVRRLPIGVSRGNATALQFLCDSSPVNLLEFESVFTDPKKKLFQKDDSKWVFKQTPWGTNTNSLSKPFPWYNNYPEYIGEATRKQSSKSQGRYCT